MTVAFVTDIYSKYVSVQIEKLSKTHTVCVFHPDVSVFDSIEGVQIRTFAGDFNESMFHRYDIVVFCTEDNWEPVIPVMQQVKGVSIIKPDSAEFSNISQLTAYQYSPDEDVASLINELPRHIHWFDREINSVLDRLTSFGLLTDEVKQIFERTYGVPLSRDWLAEF